MPCTSPLAVVQAEALAQYAAASRSNQRSAVEAMGGAVK